MVDSRKQTGPAGRSSEPAADNANPRPGDDDLGGMLEDIAMMNPADRQDGDPPHKPLSTAELIEVLAIFSHRLFQAHSAFVEARIDGHDITLRQFVLLNAISDLGSPNQRELTDMIGMDRSTLSEVIRRLASNGLILQKPSQEDARAKVVSLTDRGRKTLARTIPIISQANQEFFGALNPAEMQSLASLQARLLQLDAPQTADAEAAPSAAAVVDAGRRPPDTTASLQRLQRARAAFEADLITGVEFETEKRRYLEGEPDQARKR